MATITYKGLDKHLARMMALADNMTPVRKGLFDAGRKIEADARFSLNDGSISGPGHVASNPGEPPNTDTHHLERNISTRFRGEEASTAFLGDANAEQGADISPEVQVVSGAEYADLEFGREGIAERPYMGPASRKNKDVPGKNIATEITLTLRRRK